MLEAQFYIDLAEGASIRKELRTAIDEGYNAVELAVAYVEGAVAVTKPDMVVPGGAIELELTTFSATVRPYTSTSARTMSRQYLVATFVSQR